MDMAHELFNGQRGIVDQRDDGVETSAMLCGGMLVAMPTAIPDEP